MHSPAADDVIRTFAGLRPGERLCVASTGLWLFRGSAVVWHAARAEIVAVQAVRTLDAGHVEDRVQVLLRGGDDLAFRVGRSALDDDYEVEYAEALADGIAEAVRAVLSA